MGQGRANIYAAPFDAMAFNGMQINGAFEIGQERTGNSTTTLSYVCDGWTMTFNGTMAVAGKQITSGSPFPGLQNGLQVTVTTAQAVLGSGDYMTVSQAIEGRRVARLQWGTANAQPLTIGFFSAHHRPGTYTVVARNSSNTRGYAATYTQNVADAPEFKTVTIPGDTAGTWARDSTIGLVAMFTAAAGASITAPVGNAWQAASYYAAPGQVNAVAAVTDVFRIGGVIMLPGIDVPSAAQLPLIHRRAVDELVLCQRYYEKSYDLATLPGTVTNVGNFAFFITSGAANVGLSGISVPFKVSKRADPTVTVYNTLDGGAGSVYDAYSGTTVAANIRGMGEQGFYWFAALPGTFNGMQVTGHYVADARL